MRAAVDKSAELIAGKGLMSRALLKRCGALLISCDAPLMLCGATLDGSRWSVLTTELGTVMDFMGKGFDAIIAVWASSASIFAGWQRRRRYPFLLFENDGKGAPDARNGFPGPASMSVPFFV